MRPNSTPTFFLSSLLGRSSPELFDWVKANAMHMERCYHLDGWEVWMPIDDADGQKQEEAA